MKHVKEYYFPSTLEEALNLLYTEKSAIIAGGTHLTTQKGSSIERLIDLRNIELNYIRDSHDGFIHIGSMTTISEMIKSRLANEIGKGVLVKACKAIGDTPLRNVTTIGGNIACRVPWAGLPVVLLILDAEIEIIQQGGNRRSLPAFEFFSDKKVKTDEIIEEIIFPLKSNYYARYEKFALTKSDLAWLIAGISLKVNNGVIEDPHFAVSRIMKPIRLEQIENMLKGKKITQFNVDEITSKLKDFVSILADYRSSKEYRLQLLEAIFKRMVKEIIQEVLE